MEWFARSVSGPLLKSFIHPELPILLTVLSVGLGKCEQFSQLSDKISPTKRGDVQNIEIHPMVKLWSTRKSRVIFFIIERLPTHWLTLPNRKFIESQVLSWVGRSSWDWIRDWIFDWQVSLVYATTILCTLLLQYILKLIPCSELSFRGPKLGPHHFCCHYSWIDSEPEC